MDEIFLNTAFVDQSPSALQTAQILQIAEQCSAEGGSGVHRARPWYYALTGIQVEVNCASLIEREFEGQSTSQTQMRISPNPAQGNIFIHFTSPTGRKSKLGIFDVNGNLQKSYDIPEKDVAVEISTVELPAGIYFCRLTSEGKLIATEKIFIQR